ncbi:unnamed protein product [Caenorhabditis brenneri]
MPKLVRRVRNIRRVVTNRERGSEEGASHRTTRQQSNENGSTIKRISRGSTNREGATEGEPGEKPNRQQTDENVSARGRNSRGPTNREGSAEGGAGKEPNRQQTNEKVSARRRDTRRRVNNRERTAEGGATNEPNRQQANENVSTRRRRNNRRIANRQRESEGEARRDPETESTRECNTQQNIEYDKYDFEALYWETKTDLEFQSMKLHACLIIGLFLISNVLSSVSPGMVDGLQAVLSGFLCAALHIEQSTHLKGRRNEKYNRYCFHYLFFICGGSLLMVQNIKTLEADVLAWKQKRSALPFFFGYAGTELFKENEFMGGIMGAFTGLMLADVVWKPKEI